MVGSAGLRRGGRVSSRRNVDLCEIYHARGRTDTARIRQASEDYTVANALVDRIRKLVAREQPEPAPRGKPSQRPAQTYHAVSIDPGRHCCQGARKLQGQRFLSSEAPQLPLEHCTSDHCTCHYAHYTDRRDTPRRVSDLGVSLDSWLAEDRRKAPVRGRRKSDKTS